MNVLEPHLSLNVSSIDASVAFYEKAFGMPASKRRCYALQDKVWVENPDGNAWEVFVVKGDTDVAAHAPSASGCCVPKLEQLSGAKSNGCCG